MHTPHSKEHTAVCFVQLLCCVCISRAVCPLLWAVCNALVFCCVHTLCALCSGLCTSPWVCVHPLSFVLCVHLLCARIRATPVTCRLSLSLSQPPADLLSPEQHTATSETTHKCRKTKIHNYHKFSLEDEAEVTTNRDKQSQEVRKINLYSTQL